MSTVLDEHVPQAEAAIPPSRPRRRWWLLLVPALAIIVTAGVALGVWAWNFQPLSGDGLYSGVWSDSIDVKRKENVWGTEVILDKPPVGATATAAFTLFNTSDRFPVTIESVDIPQWLPVDGHVSSLDRVDVFVRPDEQKRATEPFTSAALGPTENLEFRLELTIADCPRRNSGSTWIESVPVTYSTLGVTHTEQVTLPYALTLHNAPQCSSRGS